MYPLLRNFLFLFDPEKVHYFSMNALAAARRIPGIGFILKKSFQPAPSPVKVFGLTFQNPVGLAAGFDKNARYLQELEMLGFGFVETGTVTPVAQQGNEKPRLFRLPQDKAIINRMGFNNDGVVAVAERIKRYKKEGGQMIIGGNIGKNKVTPNEEAWKDYEMCFRALHYTVDYFVVNVSSPNTPGLRELQQKESLRKILTHLQSLNQTFSIQRPILLKIAPDLAKEELDDVIDLALEINLDGLVATNTTLRRDNLHSLKAKESGGLSGMPLQQLAGDILKYITGRTNGKLPIISSGGISNAAEAKSRMKNGASLVQIWTAFIYEGPSVVKNISRKL